MGRPITRKRTERYKSPVIVGKDGRRYHKKIAAILAAIDDPGDKYRVEDYIQAAVAEKRQLTERNIAQLLARDRETKMLINMGYDDPALFERDYGIAWEDFMDQGNWRYDKKLGRRIFTLDGISYTLNFDYYNANALVRI